MVAGKPLLDVLQGREPSRRPGWFMRQAGRYLPEYRAVRAKAGSFLELCYNPELACEVTLQPLRRFDLDAAILFADILLVPQALGVDLAFRENEGPVLQPVRSMEDVERLDRAKAMDHLAPVFETVSRVAVGLEPWRALIGFCGAPWTVATYMVEGGTSAERAHARLAAHRGEAWLLRLVDLLAEVSADYLIGQIQAGAEVVQIFDTWAGDLPDGLRERLCVEPIARMTAAVKAAHPAVPVIGFARGLGAGHEAFARRTGVAGVGVEWSVPLDWCGTRLADVCVVQGNLDPLAVVAGGDGLTAAARGIMAAIPRHRHIFNLGHGMRPETPIENVERLVATIRSADG